ncbi:MAG: acetyl-CoA hydrolase/transferase family protein [Rhizobiaceae bacterium]|nr:MAG: acetyl-CoA hydrolase/transferase family protein [Rhizobiaceae bacterium]CAG1016064.1 acetyl-CoA hydrolase [Rhizobiaceae bacterium]
MTRHIELEELDFRGLLADGDRLIWTQGVGEPISVLERLVRHLDELPPFGAFLGASYAGIIRPEHARRVAFTGMGAVGTNRTICRDNLMDVVPCHLSALPRLMQEGRLRFDVVILQVAPMPDGSFGTGAVNGYVQFAMANARLVIAEVNELAPRTASSTSYRADDFDILVRVSRPLVAQPQEAADETDLAIARNVAGLIGDGDTLQIGIGSVPNALASVLADRRDLGLHCGVIGDSVVPLIESGVINNRRKSVSPGLTVTGSLGGTSRLIAFADMNRELRVEPVTITHAPATLAGIDNLVAVNSAIEIDITGQAGSEMAGRSYLGTIGGQNDFVRGALASRGGRSIIALPSRTAGGRARIVPLVFSGVVTVPRSDADFFVTEYGIADVRGKTLSQRARSIAAIAHPDDRALLEQATAKNG